MCEMVSGIRGAKIHHFKSSAWPQITPARARHYTDLFRNFKTSSTVTGRVENVNYFYHGRNQRYRRIRSHHPARHSGLSPINPTSTLFFSSVKTGFRRPMIESHHAVGDGIRPLPASQNIGSGAPPPRTGARSPTRRTPGRPRRSPEIVCRRAAHCDSPPPGRPRCLPRRQPQHQCDRSSHLTVTIGTS